MRHDDSAQAMHDDAGLAIQHSDAGQAAAADPTSPVDDGRRQLLKRSKAALPVVLTLTVSNGLCAS